MGFGPKEERKNWSDLQMSYDFASCQVDLESFHFGDRGNLGTPEGVQKGSRELQWNVMQVERGKQKGNQEIRTHVCGL